MTNDITDVTLGYYLKPAQDDLTRAINYFRALDPEGDELKIRIIVGELCRARTSILEASNNALCYHQTIPAELLDQERYKNLTGTIN